MTTLLWAKIEPALLFSGVMFAVMLVNLIVADKLGPKYRSTGPEDEIIDRYRTFIRRTRDVSASVSRCCSASSWASVRRRSGRCGCSTRTVSRGARRIRSSTRTSVSTYFQLPFLRFVFRRLFVVFIVVLLVTSVFPTT